MRPQDPRRVGRNGKRRGSQTTCLGCLTLVIVFSLVLGVAGVGAYLMIPARAQQVFGPPSPGLSSLQIVRYAAVLAFQDEKLTRPVDRVGAPQDFEINIGESTASIIGRLWQARLIHDPAVFRTYLQYTGLDTSLQAGKYSLSPSMTPVEIAYALQDATPSEVSLVILEGWRLEEVAEALPTSGLEVSPQEFLAAASSPQGFEISIQLPKTASLEGFLLPDTYVISRTLDTPALLSVLVGNFEQQVDEDLRAGFENQGLNLYQAVTLASIVERESVVDEEMPLIASVFYNRLAVGMKLESDPTVQYALGYQAALKTWWTNPLSLADLKFDSPYNTYVYPGLPPGPIANPGLEALRAVAFPAQTPYYYFRAGCDGSGRHLFSETFQEHLQNSCP